MDRKEAFLRSALLAPDERPLLLAVTQANADDPVWLIYADWLDEHGGREASARAEFLRVKHRLHQDSRAEKVRSQEAKLLREKHKQRVQTQFRAQIAPAWLSLIGDTRTHLLEQWGNITGEGLEESF